MEDIQKALQEFRNQIDTIDKELVYLLSRRFEAVKTIWELKKQNKAEALQPWRWQQVLDKIEWYSLEFWVDSSFTKEVWELIHAQALKLEK